MKIKRNEAIFALVNFISVKLFIFAPQRIINLGKNSAWLFVIINSAFTFLAFLLIHALYKRAGEKDILSALPKWLKIVFGVLIAAYLTVSTGLMADLLIQGVIRTFMPESPSLYISAFFLAAVLFAARKGICANVQIAMIFAPLLLIIAVLAVVLIPYGDISNLYPLLGNNDFYLPALYAFSFFADIIIFYLMIPYLENRKKALSIGVISIAVSTVFSLVVILSDILSIPSEAKFFSPFYQMVMYMSGVGGAVNIIKAFKLVFLINFIMYASTAAAFAAHSLATAFNLKYPEKLTPIIALFMLITEQHQYRQISITSVYGVFMLAAGIIFPLLPLIAYSIGAIRERRNT